MRFSPNALRGIGGNPSRCNWRQYDKLYKIALGHLDFHRILPVDPNLVSAMNPYLIESNPFDLGSATNIKMNREEAVAKVGEQAVELVESMCCQPTGKDDGETVEWSADCMTEDGRLTCYYYTDCADSEIAEECGWDGVDFKIDHYILEEA